MCAARALIRRSCLIAEFAETPWVRGEVKVEVDVEVEVVGMPRSSVVFLIHSFVFQAR